MAQITQAQYNTAKQAIRNVYIRVDLLNFDYLTIDSFSGNLLAGNLNSNANSNMRNTCDITMVVTDATFDVANQGRIWLDRLIQVYVGVDDVRTGETAWTNKGIYLINQPSYQYDATTNTMSFQGVDLMGLLTGLRGGTLTDVYLIPQGSNVRDAIIACIKENGFDQYVVSDCANTNGDIQSVPYDMEYSAGQTWWDVLDGLLQILPNYQMYFDTDGVFHYEPIPYRANEYIHMTDDIWRDNVISESVSYDFEAVKNSIKVLGKTHDVKYFPSATSISGENIILTIAALTSLPDGIIIGFVPTSAVSGDITLTVNSFGAKNLIACDGSHITSLENNVYYVARYVENGDSWEFLGHVQAVGEWKDTNPDSPFYIGAPAGEIKTVLYGDEYSNIFSDELAVERAKWEIWQRCRMTDSIQLTTVPIYWADVNWMVTYTPAKKTEPEQYLITAIGTSLDPTGTQTYTLVKYYSYYDENNII